MEFIIFSFYAELCTRPKSKKWGSRDAITSKYDVEEKIWSSSD